MNQSTDVKTFRAPTKLWITWATCSRLALPPRLTDNVSHGPHRHVPTFLSFTNSLNQLRGEPPTPSSTAENSPLSSLRTGWSSTGHANELPTTCSHDLFLRSCSSYHASRTRASPGQRPARQRRDHHPRPQVETDQERNGTRRTLFQGPSNVGRWAFTKPSLLDLEAGQRICDRGNFSRPKNSRARPHIHNVPAQKRSPCREFASRAEGGM